MDFAKSSGMAFASGINAYLPLLGLAATSLLWPDLYPINGQFVFIREYWCLAILAILTLADFFADKIPGVDNIWDAIHTILRPVAGAMVSAAANPVATDGWMAVFLALGGSLAGMTHITKALTRATSTTATGGCMNTVISIIEDIILVVSVILSLLAPVVMLVVVGVFIIVFIRMAPRAVSTFRRRWQSLPWNKGSASGPGSGGGQPPGSGRFP